MEALRILVVVVVIIYSVLSVVLVVGGLGCSVIFRSLRRGSRRPINERYCLLRACTRFPGFHFCSA